MKVSNALKCYQELLLNSDNSKDSNDYSFVLQVSQMLHKLITSKLKERKGDGWVSFSHMLGEMETVIEQISYCPNRDEEYYIDSVLVYSLKEFFKYSTVDFEIDCNLSDFPRQELYLPFSGKGRDFQTISERLTTDEVMRELDEIKAMFS